MATKRYKRPAGSPSPHGRCKGPGDTTAGHTPATEPHPSIPSINRSVCTRCGKVLSWAAA